jgi:hypothetical protein
MSTPESYSQQPPPPAAPQATAPPPVSPAPLPAPAVPVRRSPGLALVLSFFPGLGHLYLGLYQRAFAIFLCFVMAILIGEHSSVGILIAFVWFFAVIDAYRQAQALNLGLAPEPITAAAGRPKVSRHGSLGFGIFLLVIGVILFYNQFYPIDFSFLEDWWPLLLVAAGVYFVAAHFAERQRQRRREMEADVPPLDPTQSA